MAVAVPLVALGVLLARHSAFVHDDVFITLRHALNFAETGLPQWNPGEWTEGYTSALHVALSAALIRLGVDPLSAVQGLNLAAALALLALTAAGARLAAGTSLGAATLSATLLCVGAAPAVAVWVLGGLEAVMVAALLMAGLVALLRGLATPGPRWAALAALAFSAAVLTRLDAAVFIAGCGLGVLLAGAGPLRRRAGQAALVCGVPAAVALAQMGLRLHVYGEVFPLTFYAKVDVALAGRLDFAWRYLLRTLATAPVVAFAWVAIAAAGVTRRLGPQARLIAAPVALHTLYVVWTGGDHMPAARFFVVLVGPAALLLLALEAGARRGRVGLLPVVAAGTLVAALDYAPREIDHAAHVGTIVGHHIERTWPRDIEIALNTAGSTPFHASGGRVFIDMLGLNDPVIAKRENVPVLAPGQALPGHGKGDGAYVLARAPDRIILGPAEGTDAAAPWFLSDAELARLPEFRRCYEKVVERIAYSEAFAATGPRTPNPLPFTWYRRVCP